MLCDQTRFPLLFLPNTVSSNGKFTVYIADLINPYMFNNKDDATSTLLTVFNMVQRWTLFYTGTIWPQ